MVYTTSHRVRKGSRTTVYDTQGNPKCLGTIRSIQSGTEEGTLILETYCRQYKVQIVNQLTS